jgi:uncharacterized protein (TIGR03437 family)
MNAIEAPIFSFVAPEQINFQTRWELTGQQEAQVAVAIGSTLYAIGKVAIVAFAPAIFTMEESGKGQGAS